MCSIWNPILIKESACTSKIYKCVGVCTSIKMQLTTESQKLIYIWKWIIDSIPSLRCVIHGWEARISVAEFNKRCWNVFVRDKNGFSSFSFFFGLVSANARLSRWQNRSRRVGAGVASLWQLLRADSAWTAGTSVAGSEHHTELLLIHWAIKHTSSLKKLRVFCHQTKGFALNARACCSVHAIIPAASV